MTFTLSADWQISTGHLSELARPVIYVLAVALSAFVLADSRRRFRPLASAAWTLSTFFLPHIVVPFYLAARMFSPRRDDNGSTHVEDVTKTETDAGDSTTSSDANDGDETVETRAAQESTEDEPRAHDAVSPVSKTEKQRRRITMPLIYAATLLAAGALYFYFDYTSVEARLARARDAKLFHQPERARRELRAALAIEDDPHTHKLLGMEFYEAQRWDEALAEFRAAERGDDAQQDAPLIYHTAATLDALGRTDEAVAEYLKLLRTRACIDEVLVNHCATARSRLQALGRVEHTP